MTQTFIALLFAHAVADFIFQTRAMVAAKDRFSGLVVHGIIVFLSSWIAVGGDFSTVLAWLAVAHILTDWVKRAFGDGLAPFLVDQAVHVATLAIAAAVWPGLWAAGLWSEMPELNTWMGLLAGAIFATRAGDFTVAKLMVRFPGPGLSDGSAPGAGRAIGNIERLLAYLFLLMGQPTAIALLVGAKSILRFGSVGHDRRASEYVLVGTLASIAWAILCALAALALVGGVTFAPPAFRM